MFVEAKSDFFIVVSRMMSSVEGLVCLGETVSRGIVYRVWRIDDMQLDNEIRQQLLGPDIPENGHVNPRIRDLFNSLYESLNNAKKNLRRLECFKFDDGLGTEFPHNYRLLYLLFNSGQKGVYMRDIDFIEPTDDIYGDVISLYCKSWIEEEIF